MFLERIVPESDGVEVEWSCF